MKNLSVLKYFAQVGMARHTNNFPKPISHEPTGSCTPTHRLVVSVRVPNGKVQTVDWMGDFLGFNFHYLHSLIVRIQGCADSCCIT